MERDEGEQTDQCMGKGGGRTISHCRWEDGGRGVIRRIMSVVRKGNVWNMHGKKESRVS